MPGPPAVASADRALTFTPSESQRTAIQAGLGPMLVLAGPGAGKTYCLIERIRFLVEKLDFDPARICAFTFTNKAAEEIGARLARDLGPTGELVRRGTIHAFCTDLLRRHGDIVRLGRGFGIADDEYQKSVLSRLRVPPRAQATVLRGFTLHRLGGRVLSDRDTRTFGLYTRLLEQRNLVDFDALVMKARELLRHDGLEVRGMLSAFDYVLVDEFQDLSKAQYDVICELVRDHRNLFAVGDYEQSIYSWAGADPEIFKTFANHFGVVSPHTLTENRRCPRQTFALARQLIQHNPPIFSGAREIFPERDTPFPVRALSFEDDADELAWLLDDITADHEASGLRWGEYALLYRRNAIGDSLEAGLVGAGIPCRLAQGRALADDRVVGSVVASLRVICRPMDSIHRDDYLRAVLPRSLTARLQSEAERDGTTLSRHALAEANRLPREDEDGRRLRRARAALRNLEALGRKHTSLTALVEELLSQPVGYVRSILEKEERLKPLLDPAADPEVVRLSRLLQDARRRGTPVFVTPMSGVGLPLKVMLDRLAFPRTRVEADPPPGALTVAAVDSPLPEFALRFFKALQLVTTSDATASFQDFTAIDLETTDKDVQRAEITQIGAVRVRQGRIVAEYASLVKPRVPISTVASRITGIRAKTVANAPYFENVWGPFREFCGDDVLVAHNGHSFDFQVLKRMSASLQNSGARACTYDSLVLARDLHAGSCRLPDLAHHYGIDPGRHHDALHDARTLAQVIMCLESDRIVRARKTALVGLLDLLGVALAIGEAENLPEDAEPRRLLEITSARALGRYSDALDNYRAERDAMGDESIPSADDVIERLGGLERMLRIRAERTADQRHPAAMTRMRRLLGRCADGALETQIADFLQLLALSARQEGPGVDRDRVNLLTLHATKGLEFSRVCIVGVEDNEMPGGTPLQPATPQEIEEARRLLYVGMTRAKDRLILTRTAMRGGRPTGGHRFLDEMGLTPMLPADASEFAGHSLP